MELVYERIDKVICKNKNGDEFFLLHATSFYENMEEVIIGTQVINTDLTRGWQGDIICQTTPAIDLTGLVKHSAIEDTFNDVILVKIRPSWNIDSVVEWEYVFYKH